MKAFLCITLILSFWNLTAQEYGLPVSELKYDSSIKINPNERIFNTNAIAQSSIDLWDEISLEGGEMTSIVMDPDDKDIIYVSTRAAGVYKTTDGGKSWFSARKGLSFYPIRCLTIDPLNPSVIYAGTDNDGIYKSTDGGTTWIKTGYQGDLIVFNIVINPQNPQIIYAIAAGGAGLYVGNIHKSVDGGKTWNPSENGIPHIENSDFTHGIFSIDMEKSNPNILYAGGVIDGVYKTTDGGDNWIAFNDSIPEYSPNFLPDVNAISVNPHTPGHPSILLYGKYYVFNGSYWENYNDTYAGGGVGPSKLYHHPIDPLKIYTNENYSLDGGKNWNRFVKDGNGEDRHSIVDLVLTDSGFRFIIAATEYLFDTKAGVIKSKNYGGSWDYSSYGINAQNIRSLAVDKTNPEIIYTGTGSGHFYSSHNGGVDWERGFYYIYYESETKNQKYFNFSQIKDIVINPSNKNEIFIISKGLYKSEDSGIIFAKVDSISYPKSIAISGNPNTVIYVGGGFGKGIKKSIDNGATWESKNNGLPVSTSFDYNPITCITIDPNNNSSVWAGTQYGGGILKSDNGGDNWTVKGLTEENIVRAIAINPNNSDEILVGTEYSSNKIYKSIDGGETWALMISDIAAVQEFVYDPRDTRQIYAATEGYGIMRSGDGGETWELYNDGLFFPLHYCIDITNEVPPRLFTGSYGSGLYSTSPSLFTDVVEYEQLNPTCNGYCNGSIKVSDVNNVVKPFTYLWSTGETSANILNLCVGTYSVTITDANNCSVIHSFDVVEPKELAINTIITDETVKDANDGTAISYTWGGTKAYSYNWSSGDTTQAISGLSPGTYFLTVTDANGCTALDTITVKEFTCPNLAVNSQPSNISCFGACDGSIAVLSVNNATSPLSYKWNTGATSASLNNLCAGDYSVTISDSKNCEVAQNYKLTQPDEITITVDSTRDVRLDPLGYIAITTNNNGNYIFSWTGPGNFTANTENLDNLNDFGCYTLTVIDTTTNCSIDSTICLEDKTATLDFEFSNINIYPNPTKGNFIIDFNNTRLKQAAITIFDLSGKQQIYLEKRTSDKVLNIESEVLNSGLYIIRIKSAKFGTSHRKIVICK